MPCSWGNRGYSQVGPEGSVKIHSAFLHVGDTLSCQAQGRRLLPKEHSLEEKSQLALLWQGLSRAAAAAVLACFLLRLAWCLWAWMGSTLIPNTAVGEWVACCPMNPPGAWGVQVNPNVPHQVQLHPAVHWQRQGCNLCLAAFGKTPKPGRKWGEIKKVPCHPPACVSCFPLCTPLGGANKEVSIILHLCPFQINSLTNFTANKYYCKLCTYIGILIDAVQTRHTYTRTPMCSLMDT